MTLSMAKNVQMCVNLDVLKMVDDITTAVILDINNAFFSNGSLSTENATRSLHRIKGKMQALSILVDNTK